eukprot:scaffold5337_cov411-Prasinococcus_capsulatus_cf.AAC.9
MSWRTARTGRRLGDIPPRYVTCGAGAYTAGSARHPMLATANLGRREGEGKNVLHHHASRALTPCHLCQKPRPDAGTANLSARSVLSVPHARSLAGVWCPKLRSAPQQVRPRTGLLVQGSASGSNTPSLESQSQPGMLAELADFLRSRVTVTVQGDLPHLFDDIGIDTSKYADSVEFVDPITKYESIGGYLFNIQMLRRLFRPIFQLHDVYQTAENELTTRWTMTMKHGNWEVHKARYGLEGITCFLVWSKRSVLVAPVDRWDSVDDNSYFSVEALQDLVKQLFQIYATPDLETPKYTVLQRNAEFEVRQYEPFLVAETNMPGKGQLAEGSGFNKLAQYIFGGNEESRSMEMTTPVFTRMGEDVADDQEVMQFVLGGGLSLSTAPRPAAGSGVRTREVPAALYAVRRFSGVVASGGRDEEALRQMMLLKSEVKKAGLQVQMKERNGQTVEASVVLARYNEPSAPPPTRRNEVLLPLESFKFREEILYIIHASIRTDHLPPPAGPKGSIRDWHSLRHEHSTDPIARLWCLGYDPDVSWASCYAPRLLSESEHLSVSATIFWRQDAALIYLGAVRGFRKLQPRQGEARNRSASLRPCVLS